MALTFPRRDRPAEFNYITFPISAAPLPDRSDVQASPSIQDGEYSRQPLLRASPDCFLSSSSTPTPTVRNVNPVLAGMRAGSRADTEDPSNPPPCFPTPPAAL